MQRDDSQEGPTPAEDVRYDDAEQLTASTSAAAEGVEPNRSSLPLGRSVPRYLAAALCTTVIMTVADAVQAAFSEAGPRVSVGEFGAAVLFLLAFTLPVTIGVALAFAGLGWLIRATPATESVRRRLTPRAWVAKDPEGFATGIGSVVGLGVLALGGRELFAVLTMRVHRADLAAWAMGGLVIVLVLTALLSAMGVRALLLPIARRLGRFAGVWAVLLVFLVVLFGGVLPAVLPGLIDARNAYGGLAIAWLPLSVIVLLVSVALLGAFWSRVVPSPRAGRRLGASICLVAAAGWLVAALTYGMNNAARSVVEQRSVSGRRLVQRYARLTDQDRDGHSWAFGGRDCDDFDSNVHPGAADPPGDGVDGDCFAGDGSPQIQVLSDGAMGALPAGFPERPNLILVTIDALRPDHLGTFGYSRPTSPNIDRFAERAVRFRNAYAASSRSIRSIPAMMAGCYPSEVAFGNEYLYPAILPDNVLVPELLADRGYQTAVTMGTDYFHRTQHFFQGFEDVREILVYKPPRGRAMDAALRQLDELESSQQPYFLWVHLFNVHGPYLRPPLPSRFGEQHVDAYDTEIYQADLQFQRLVNALDERGSWDDTVVVLASDHGEALNEHGVLYHSTSLYDEQLASTLIVRAPGFEPRLVETTVSLHDFFATALNFARIEAPDVTSSRSLVPLMGGHGEEAAADRYLIAELMPDGLFPQDVKSLRYGNYKLIWQVREGTVQLFDLAEDPGELNDLSDEQSGRTEEMLGLLQAWVAQSARPESRNEVFVEQHRLEAAPDQMTHPLDLRYPGMFTVIGCDVPRTDLYPGDTLDITCYYRADAEMEQDFFFRVMLEPPRGITLPRDFHAMHFPLHSRYHTNAWRAGEILADPSPIVVPPELPTPMDLRLTFAIHVRGQGLQRFTQSGRASFAATIDTVRIRPRPTDGPAGATDGGPRRIRRPDELRIPPPVFEERATPVPDEPG